LILKNASEICSDENVDDRLNAPLRASHRLDMKGAASKQTVRIINLLCGASCWAGRKTDDSTASPVRGESAGGKKETGVSGKGSAAEQEGTIVICGSSVAIIHLFSYIPQHKVRILIIYVI
jgi:hypothetical protein